jgi:hypothetical protein
MCECARFGHLSRGRLQRPVADLPSKQASKQALRIRPAFCRLRRAHHVVHCRVSYEDAVQPNLGATPRDDTGGPLSARELAAASSSGRLDPHTALVFQQCQPWHPLLVREWGTDGVQGLFGSCTKDLGHIGLR